MADDVNSIKQKQVDEDTQGAIPRPNLARRRLLRGAALVPSVYTLSSGAQTALASNLTCFANSLSTSQSRFVGTDDNWLRSTVAVAKSGSDTAFCVMDKQWTCMDPLNPNKAQGGTNWVINGSRITVGPRTTITTAGQNTITPAGKNKMYGLIYVNQQGTITTLDPNGSPDLHPVAESCWTSMLGGRASPLG